MIPFHHTQSIHPIYLKVLADLLHHLQLGFISWKLKDRMTQLIKLTDDIVILALPLPCAQQGLSDLISFTFSVQFDQKVHQETHSHRHTLSHTHIPLTGLKLIALITSPMLSTGAPSLPPFNLQTIIYKENIFE